MGDAPERIWLIPLSGENLETTWCSDPAPAPDMDPGAAFGPYILATPSALAAHPTVQALTADAEARGLDRAAFIAWDEEDETVNRTWENWGEHRNMVTAQTVQKEIAAAIRAEAAAIRRAEGETT